MGTNRLYWSTAGRGDAIPVGEDKEVPDPAAETGCMLANRLPSPLFPVLVLPKACMWIVS